MGGPEAPKAPEAVNEEAAAAKKMGDVMPPGEFEFKDEPIAAEELKEMTKGYPETDIEGHQDVIDAAKKGIKEKAEKADSLHKSSYTVIGGDGYEYVYIYDKTHTPNDRLFKSKEPVVSLEESEYADQNLKDGYTVASLDQTKNIAKAVAKLLEGEPPSIIVDKADLVANRILTKEEAFKIKGDVAYAVKIKGETKVYFGWEKKQAS